MQLVDREAALSLCETLKKSALLKVHDLREISRDVSEAIDDAYQDDLTSLKNRMKICVRQLDEEQERQDEFLDAVDELGDLTQKLQDFRGTPTQLDGVVEKIKELRDIIEQPYTELSFRRLKDQFGYVQRSPLEWKLENFPKFSFPGGVLLETGADFAFCLILGSSVTPAQFEKFMKVEVVTPDIRYHSSIFLHRSKDDGRTYRYKFPVRHKTTYMILVSLYGVAMHPYILKQSENSSEVDTISSSSATGRCHCESKNSPLFADAVKTSAENDIFGGSMISVGSSAPSKRGLGRGRQPPAEVVDIPLASPGYALPQPSQTTAQLPAASRPATLSSQPVPQPKQATAQLPSASQSKQATTQPLQPVAQRLPTTNGVDKAARIPSAATRLSGLRPTNRPTPPPVESSSDSSPEGMRRSGSTAVSDISASLAATKLISTPVSYNRNAFMTGSSHTESKLTILEFVRATRETTKEAIIPPSYPPQPQFVSPGTQIRMNHAPVEPKTAAAEAAAAELGRGRGRRVSGAGWGGLEAAGKSNRSSDNSRSPSVTSPNAEFSKANSATSPPYPTATAPVTRISPTSTQLQSKVAAQDAASPATTNGWNGAKAVSTVTGPTKCLFVQAAAEKRNVVAKLMDQFGSERNLHFPIGITSTKNRRFFVCDTGNHRVRLFQGGAKEPQLTLPSDSREKMQRPSATIFLPQRNELLVKDDKQVFAINPDTGAVIRKFAHVFSHPYGLELTAENTVLVLDEVKRCHPELKQFSLDGTLIRSDSLQVPELCSGESVGRKGSISKCRFIATRGNAAYTVDLGYSFVYKTDLRGKHLVTFGGYGRGPGQMNEPSGIQIDEHGHVIIADSRNDRIQVYDADGHFMTGISCQPSIIRPSGIHLTPWGQLAIVNYIRHHVKLYDLE